MICIIDNISMNLHIRTTHSDGGNSPAEIVAMLKDATVTSRRQDMG